LHQLDAIAKRIVNVTPPEAGQLELNWPGLETTIAQSDPQLIEVLDEQGNMSFSRRFEVSIDAQVNLQRTRGNPKSSSIPQRRWFRDFPKAHRIDIEVARHGLAIRRYGDHHVME